MTEEAYQPRVIIALSQVIRLAITYLPWEWIPFRDRFICGKDSEDVPMSAVKD